MRTNADDVFLYVYNCELHANVQIKIGEFEGLFREAANPTRRLTQLFAEVSVYCNNRPIGYPVSTSYRKNPENNRQKVIQQWQEWLTLPIRYSDLSRDAFVHITVWEVDQETTPIDSTFSRNMIAQAHMPLFSKRGILKSGVIDVQMSTDNNVPDPFQKLKQTWKYSDNSDSNVESLFKQVNRQSRSLIEHVPWLDPFTSRKVEQIRSQQKLNAFSRTVFIVIEMAVIRYGSNYYEVVYYEDETKNLRISASLGGVAIPFTRTSVADPELNMESLSEIKHNIMTRRIRDGAGDRQLKPNKQAKDRLEAIIKLPPSQQLTREQRDLVWKFRYYLREDRKALNKFLRSVNWDQPQEEQSALALMNDWALIEAEDALELLSPAFTHQSVRAYAVSRLLNAASPEQVLLYLPQLVQALKYEQISPPYDTSFVAASVSTAQPSEADEKETTMGESKLNGDLATFLIDNAVVSPRMSNFLYWYLKVEIESAKQTSDVSKMYSILQDRLLEALIKKDETRAQAESIQSQIQFVEDLKKITNQAKSHGSHSSKETALRTILALDKHMCDLRNVTLPLDPTIRLTSCNPENAAMFKSALLPVKLSFNIQNGDTYTCIFKEGDDLRQDQLIIQMIRLMDSLFKKDQLDLRLTPYAVLATGIDEGFVQFVKARPLRIIEEQYKPDCIKQFMKEARPGSGPYGIEQDVIDNYVRSLAGYSVITYVLGIGDRHLDNILLCENGKLFHVDFGFILGRDPKLGPPPMKLTGDMVAAMGGVNGSHMSDFRQYCDSAYRILRRHSNVLLNLFSLMLDAGIPDIASEPDKALFKIEQRLRLELSDEAATKHIFSQIETSIHNSKMGALSDIIHGWKVNLM